MIIHHALLPFKNRRNLISGYFPGLFKEVFQNFRGVMADFFALGLKTRNLHLQLFILSFKPGTFAFHRLYLLRKR